jgi:hypothetical protein
MLDRENEDITKEVYAVADVLQDEVAKPASRVMVRPEGANSPLSHSTSPQRKPIKTALGACLFTEKENIRGVDRDNKWAS